MIKKAVGVLLIALPLTTLVGLYIADKGWVGVVTTIGGVLFGALIVTGVWLLEGGDRR